MLKFSTLSFISDTQTEKILANHNELDDLFLDDGDYNDPVIVYNPESESNDNADISLL